MTKSTIRESLSGLLKVCSIVGIGGILTNLAINDWRADNMTKYIRNPNISHEVIGAINDANRNALNSTLYPFSAVFYNPFDEVYIPDRYK